MNDDLLRLEKSPGDADLLQSLFRSAHTVKGAARVVGVRAIETLCHAMETFFSVVRNGGLELAAEHFPVFFATVDALAEAADDIEREEPVGTVASSALAQLFEELAAGGALPEDVDRWLLPLRRVVKPTQSTPEPSHVEPTPDSGLEDTASGPDVPDEAKAESADGQAASRRPRDMRVDVSNVERLFGPIASLTEVAADVRVVTERVDRLRGEIERWARDPGQSGHGSDHIFALRERAEAVARDSRNVGDAVSRTASELQSAVEKLRLRPVADAFDALPRAVRDLAREEGKEVELVVEENTVQADRSVIDALREPLLHLVRNAVDHGVETPEERVAAGKPRRAAITIRTERHGGRLRVLVSDDGRGLDPTAVRVHLGSTAVDLSDEEVINALFRGGISTRQEVSEISGRGVGLDTVRDRMESIRGHVRVDWGRGTGTTFALEFPPSPAALRVLLVSVDSDVFALPVADIEKLERIRSEEIRFVEGRPVIDRDGTVPLTSLADALGPPLIASPQRATMFTVILESGGARLALVVDDLVDEMEVIVRPIAGSGSANSSFFGGALLPGNRVAPVVDGRSLITAALDREVSEPFRQDLGSSTSRAKNVLVVDDSLTTRSLEQTVLEAAGYRVSTAVDGRDGWRKLQEDVFDLVVSDVEMPREDGLALCRRIRSSQRLRDLPVILVTGLEDETEREAGLEAGASAYLGKSQFDQDSFLETVHQFLGDVA